MSRISSDVNMNGSRQPRRAGRLAFHFRSPFALIAFVFLSALLITPTLCDGIESDPDPAVGFHLGQSYG